MYIREITSHITLWIVLTIVVDCCFCEAWKISTACYGSDARCSTYSMQCESGKRIVVGELKYGFKTDSQCVFGVSDCDTEASRICCSYNQSDTFVDFSIANRTNVILNCEGKKNCSDRAPRIAKLNISSYVWLQYACVDQQNTVDMCTSDFAAGSEIFLQFSYLHNLTTDLSPSITSSTNCSCQITAPTCQNQMILTLIQTQLRKPVNDSGSLACSDSTIYTERGNITVGCSDGGLNVQTVNLPSANEVISLVNIPHDVPFNAAEQVYISIRSLSGSPLMVKCFPSGTKPPTTNTCSSTGSTTTATPPPTTTSASVSTSVPRENTIPLTSPSLSSKPTIFTKPASTMAPAILSVTTIPTTSISTSSTASSTTTNTSSITLSSSGSASSPSTTSTTTANPSSSKSTSTSPSKTSDNLSSEVSTLTTIAASKTETKSNEITIDQDHTKAISATNTSVETTTKTSVDSEPAPSISIFSNNSPTTSLKTALSQSTKSVSISTKPTTQLSDGNASLSMAQSSSTSLTAISSNESLATTSKHSSVSISSTVSLDASTLVTDSRASDKSIIISGRTYSTGWNDGSVTLTENEQSTISVTKGNDEDGSDKGLIIGVTVAAVLAMIIFVGVLVVCLWHRTKRKAAVRRHYVRNTNIFYSFPQDYEDMENMPSKNTDDPKEVDYSEIEYAYPPLPNGTTNGGDLVTQPLYGSTPFDSYRIKPPDVKPITHDENWEHRTKYPTNSTINSDFSKETRQETMHYFNGVAKASGSNGTTGSQKHVTGNKSVKFDPSSLYATVNKEGKTKF